jgi:hypothetical protein
MIMANEWPAAILYRGTKREIAVNKVKVTRAKPP